MMKTNDNHAAVKRAIPESAGNLLARIVRAAAALRPGQNLDVLRRNLIGLLFDVAPASRAAVVLIATNSLDVESTCIWDKTGPLPLNTLDAGVIHRILEEGVGHIARRSAPDCDSHHSIVAVPIGEFPRITAILYMESDGAEAPLDTHHLECANAIAAIAAHPLEHARNSCLTPTGSVDQLKNKLIGESPAIRQARTSIHRIAESDSTALISGESGTGKELAAQAIHSGSLRAKCPFVALNCAAVADTLLESELFGYERGAFTGATAQTRGKIELANKGTLFLDEVGELPLALQAKLLRVLQEREFERVGGRTAIKVDLRLISATNRNLREMVAEGRFRSDLFFRLNVVPLKMPPLRERPEDILPLATHFLHQRATAMSRAVNGISPRARSAFLAYGWPGNVRELQNAVERALVLGQSSWLELEDLPEEVVEAHTGSSEDDAGYHAMVLDSKRRILRNAVDEARGQYVEAARSLGINVKYLHRLMRNYNLKVDSD